MVGSEEFKHALQRDLEKLGSPLEKAELLGLDRVPEWRDEPWAKVLHRGARALKINLERLPDRKSAPQKVQLAALLKMRTAVLNGWLATRLRMGQPASVSQFVRCFRLASGDQATEFKAALSRVTL